MGCRIIIAFQPFYMLKAFLKINQFSKLIIILFLVLFLNNNKPDNLEKKELGLSLIIPDENQGNIRPAENEIVLFEENNNS